jgi:hypothetical protein
MKVNSDFTTALQVEPDVEGVLDLHCRGISAEGEAASGWSDA